MGSSVNPLFDRAADQMRAGQLDEARLGFEQVLLQNPNHLDTLIHLAHVESLANHHEKAAEHLSHAVRLKKSDAVLRFALAEALSAAGKFTEAVAAYQKAIDLQPNSFEAHNALGERLGWMNLPQQALHHLQRASQIRPNDPGPMITMTMLLLKLGKAAESIDMGRRASALASQSPIAHINYANALLSNGQSAEAADQFRIAIACNPSFGAAHSNLSVALEALGDFDKSAFHRQRAIELSPEFALGWANVARVLTMLGEVPRAIELVRQGLRLHPGISLWGTLLFSLSYTDMPQEQILREHQQMVERFPPDLTPCPSRPPLTGRRLRVGYISPDFRDHPVASFIEPILKYHDRARVEVFCYSTTTNTDEVAKRLQSYPAEWRNIETLSNVQATEQIQQDQLDILIDLAGHTAKNRIELLFHRNATVQVSYLGYPTTTGLPTLDVRLTDAIADPPGQNDAFYSERLVQLPGCFCCFTPPNDPPNVSPLPAATNSRITFGSLHTLAKITDRVLDLWAEILKSIPQSHLLMLRNTLTVRAQARILAAFNERGIDASRLTLRNDRPAGGYLAAYHDIDISLDTFPFTGHTTACQSLLMGVPIITLLGDSHRHRLVASVLTHAGFPPFIATSPVEYIRIAQSLASDLDQLASLRQSLRKQLLASPLCDGQTFTRQFESTLFSFFD